MRLTQSSMAAICLLAFLASPRTKGGQIVAVNSLPVRSTNWVEPGETLVVDYIPHLHGRPWPSLPIIRYAEITSNVWAHPSDPTKFPTMQEAHDSDADFATVVLRLPGGEVYKTYNDLVLGPYLGTVYSGDFNNDGVPDFFAIKPTTGCGIAGEQSLGVFAFSQSTNGYRFTRVHGWGLGRHSLVTDPATKTFRFMHTRFCSAKCVDGRYHSFWVHRFFKWDSDSLRLDDYYPPIWVQYLLRPNHEPTKLLTSQMKAEAWAAERDVNEIHCD